jgi:hypothetical protein
MTSYTAASTSRSGVSRSLDLPIAPSMPSSCCWTSRRHCRRLLTCFRLVDLPVSLLLPALGQQTSQCLHRRCRQVAKPPYNSIDAFVRSLDLPVAVSLPSPGFQTSMRHSRRRLQVGGPPSVSIAPWFWSVDLLVSLSSHALGRRTSLDPSLLSSG